MQPAPAQAEVVLSAPRKNWPSYVPLAAVCLMVLFIAGLRYRMLSAPLDRDEGEYAYSAQLVLDGYPPFLHAYSMKLPGTLYAYAAIMSVFGETPEGIRLGFLLMNACSTFLVFYLGRRWIGEFGAACAALCFALLSTDAGVFGFHAEATHFVIFSALIGIALLVAATDRGQLSIFLLAGIAFGLAFLMKQHGIFFLLFAVFYVAAGPEKKFLQSRNELLRRLALLFLGAALPFVLVCLRMYAAGVFGRFVFWTFSYAHKYASEVPARISLRVFYTNFFTHVVSYSFPLWILAAVCLLIVLWLRIARRWTFLTFLGLSFAATIPGFFFREHYYVLVLPAVALIIGSGIEALWLRWKARWPRFGGAAAILLLCFCFGLTLVGRRFYFFDAPNYDPSVLFGRNPFAEIIPVAEYIRDHSSPQERVAVLGSEPELFFYAHRVAASGHIYMYGLMEEQPLARQMQHEFIQETEAARPKFVVLVNDNLSWFPQPKSVPDLAQWVPQFLKKYKQVGLVKIHPDAQAGGTPSPAEESSSHDVLLIFERL